MAYVTGGEHVLGATLADASARFQFLFCLNHRRRNVSLVLTNELMPRELLDTQMIKKCKHFRWFCRFKCLPCAMGRFRYFIWKSDRQRGRELKKLPDFQVIKICIHYVMATGEPYENTCLLQLKENWLHSYFSFSGQSERFVALYLRESQYWRPNTITLCKL